MIKSKIDGTICKNNLGLSTHLKKYGLTLLEYYVKYENFGTPKCSCGKDCKLIGGLNFRDTCGGKLCLSKLRENIRHSEDSKEKIRKARINHLKKTRGVDSAWKRRSEGKMSKGEEKLHDIFTQNGVYTKYMVVNEYCEFPYFIDFAFVNEKVAVEYDGRCHFNYGLNRVEHDHKKDLELKNKGWRIYRIPYFELDDFNLSDLMEFIGNPVDVSNFDTLIKYGDYITKIEKKKYYCECGNEKGKTPKHCVTCSNNKRRKVERPQHEQLVNEIKELGYVGVGRKYGVSDNAVRKWLKNYGV